MKILKADSRNLDTAVGFLKRGKIIVCPTDTVYGLICDASNKKAVQKLFKIKKRDSEKFVPIFIKDLKATKKLAFINEEQEKILKKVWPGKTTVILKRREGKKIYGIDKKTIGLRIPKYKFINNLLSSANRPLTGTSANISGKPASTKIKEVLNQFEGRRLRPDLIIDAGELKSSRPSKIIDLTGDKIKVLRK
jgi:L-threonylcarbamoyladenylate synthase